METKAEYTVNTRLSEKTATLAGDLLEHVAALENVIEMHQQTIAAMQVRIDTLEAELRERDE